MCSDLTHLYIYIKINDANYMHKTKNKLHPTYKKFINFFCKKKEANF